MFCLYIEASSGQVDFTNLLVYFGGSSIHMFRWSRDIWDLLDTSGQYLQVSRVYNGLLRVF